MTILITGGAGLVGSLIVEKLRNVDFTVVAPTSQEMDITSPESVHKYCEDHMPFLVIHCAAFTDVTAAEGQRGDEEGPAWKLNVIGTNNVVNATKEHGAFLIHISTDMVFSGRKDEAGPYTENHPVETDQTKVSWYGWTKIQSEFIIRNAMQDHSIIRISNPARAKYPKKLDYVRKILALYDQKNLHPLFTDQYLTLSYINEVADAISNLIHGPKNGTFHVSSTNMFTPFGLAEYLLKEARDAEGVVKKSSIVDFLKQPGNSARYMQYGGLDTTHTQHDLGMTFHTWQQTIDSLIDEGIEIS